MGFTKRVTKSVEKYIKNLKFFCPLCGRKTRIAESKKPLGKKKLCKGCGHTFELTEKHMQAPWASDTSKITELPKLEASPPVESLAPEDPVNEREDVVELESCLPAKSVKLEIEKETARKAPESAYEKTFPDSPLERVGFLWRFLANILDSFILGCLIYMLSILLVAVIIASAAAGGRPGTGSMAMIIAAVCLGMLCYLSIECFWGITPGKLILGLKIGSQQGFPAHSDVYATRFLIKVLPGFVMSWGMLMQSTVIYILGAIAAVIVFLGAFAIFSSKKQCLWDIIAGTAVFKKKELDERKRIKMKGVCLKCNYSFAIHRYTGKKVPCPSCGVAIRPKRIAVAGSTPIFAISIFLLMCVFTILSSYDAMSTVSDRKKINNELRARELKYRDNSAGEQKPVDATSAQGFDLGEDVYRRIARMPEHGWRQQWKKREACREFQEKYSKSKYASIVLDYSKNTEKKLRKEVQEIFDGIEAHIKSGNLGQAIAEIFRFPSQLWPLEWENGTCQRRLSKMEQEISQTIRQTIEEERTDLEIAIEKNRDPARFSTIKWAKDPGIMEWIRKTDVESAARIQENYTSCKELLNSCRQARQLYREAKKIDDLPAAWRECHSFPKEWRKIIDAKGNSYRDKLDALQNEIAQRVYTTLKGERDKLQYIWNGGKTDTGQLISRKWENDLEFFTDVKRREQEIDLVIVERDLLIKKINARAEEIREKKTPAKIIFDVCDKSGNPEPMSFDLKPYQTWEERIKANDVGKNPDFRPLGEVTTSKKGRYAVHVHTAKGELWAMANLTSKKPTQVKLRVRRPGRVSFNYQMEKKLSTRYKLTAKLVKNGFEYGEITMFKSSGETGVFAIKPIQPGKYTVIVNCFSKSGKSFNWVKNNIKFSPGRKKTLKVPLNGGSQSTLKVKFVDGRSRKVIHPNPGRKLISFVILRDQFYPVDDRETRAVLYQGIKSDKKGYYVFENMPTGRFRLYVRFPDRKAVTKKINISGGVCKKTIEIEK